MARFDYRQFTMSQPTIVSATSQIRIPCERAWELLRDLSLAHHYVPGLVKSEITTECREGVGASRKVFQSEAKGIDETVAEWIDGHGFLIRLHCGDCGAPFPFEQAHFRYAIAAHGPDTLLTASLIYAMRWGAVGRALDRLLLRRFIERRIRDVALSMRIYYETGERVTPQRLKRAKKEVAAIGENHRH